MTFKDLQKLVQGEAGQISSTANLQARLQGKPFWYWDPTAHRKRDRINKGDCCFNHIIGLPLKNEIPKPMFDYEKMLYDALMRPGFLNGHPGAKPHSDQYHHLFNDKDRRYSNISDSDKVKHTFKEKHLWVKKATGLGVTEFFLRFMAWLCLRNDDCTNGQMVIITGPNQELAIKLIKRMKALFEPHAITFDSKETLLELNGCEIQAYPSNHIDAFRSLTNPKFILVEEGDFFRKNEQDDVRHVAERYIAKSDPYIVLVSTPNAPDGLFERIEKESFDTCIYKKLFLDYSYGLDKIYTKAEIDKAKVSPSFEREYCLKY